MPSAQILFVQDPRERRGIDREEMERRYSGALDFLTLFEPELRSRAAFKRYYTRKNRGTIIETGPFWSMLNVGSYTLAQHKVVWKEQAADFTAAVMPQTTPVPLPNHKVFLVECRSDDEAHYLCGVLNSRPVRLFVAAYAVETQISTHTVKYIHIPEFDSSQPEHGAIRAASQAAHAATARGEDSDQSSLDLAAAKLWGLEPDEVDAMRVFFERLRKRDLGLEEQPQEDEDE
mgnify:CR=1 FL=1